MTGSPGFDLASPDRPFDDILNFRDVGRSINDIYGSKCDSLSLSPFLISDLIVYISVHMTNDMA